MSENPQEIDLLVSLENPARLCLATPDSQHTVYENKPALLTMHPGWPVLFDILCHPNSREFLGLAVRVPDPFTDEVKARFEKCDDRVFQYLSAVQADEQLLYGEDGSESDYLLVLWSEQRPFVCEVAQLIEGVWLYEDCPDGIREEGAIQALRAIGVSPFDLTDYRLSMPKLLHLEEFQLG